MSSTIISQTIETDNHNCKEFYNLLLCPNPSQQQGWGWLKLGHKQFFWSLYDRDKGFIKHFPTQNNPIYKGSEDKREEQSRYVELTPINHKEFIRRNKQIGEGVFLAGYQPDANLPLAKAQERSRNIIIEQDLGTREEQWQKIKDFEAYAGINFWVISSGGKSLHSHLMLSEYISVPEMEYMRRLFVLVMQSDRMLCNHHQPYRAPGFLRGEKDGWQELLQKGGIYDYQETKQKLEQYCLSKKIPEECLNPSYLSYEFINSNGKSEGVFKALSDPGANITALVEYIKSSPSELKPKRKATNSTPVPTYDKETTPIYEQICRYYLEELSKKGWGNSGTGTYDRLLAFAGAVQSITPNGLQLLKEYFPQRSIGTMSGHGLPQLLRAGKSEGIKAPLDILRKLRSQKKQDNKLIKEWRNLIKATPEIISINQYCSEKLDYVSELVEEHGIIALSAPLGSGKTHLLKLLLDRYPELAKKGLGHSTTLNNQAEVRLSDENTTYYILPNEDKEEYNFAELNHISCTDSADKMPVDKDTPYITFCDEFSSVFKHTIFSGTTVKQKRIEVLEKTKYMWENTQYGIGLDGTATNLDIEYMSKLTGKKVPFIEMQLRLRQKEEIFRIENREQFLNEALKSALIATPDKPMGYVSDSKDDIKSMAALLTSHGVKCIAIHSESIDDDEVKLFLSDINKAIKSGIYQVILFSPTISSGVDITVPFGDVLSGFWGVLGTQGSCQMIKRIRNAERRFIWANHSFPYEQEKIETPYEIQQKDIEQQLLLAIQDGDTEREQECRKIYQDMIKNDIHYQYKTKIERQRLIECKYFKQLLYEYLQMKGWEIAEYVPEAEETTIKEELKQIKASQKITEAIAVKNAAPLNEQDAKYLKKKVNLTQKQKQQLKKYNLQDSYPGIAYTEYWGDLPLFLIWEINKDYFSQLYNRVLFQSPKVLRALQYSQSRKIKEKEKWIGDYSSYRAIETLRELIRINPGDNLTRGDIEAMAAELPKHQKTHKYALTNLNKAIALIGYKFVRTGNKVNNTYILKDTLTTPNIPKIYREIYEQTFNSPLNTPDNLGEVLLKKLQQKQEKIALEINEKKMNPENTSKLDRERDKVGENETINPIQNQFHLPPEKLPTVTQEQYYIEDDCDGVTFDYEDDGVTFYEDYEDYDQEPVTSDQLTSGKGEQPQLISEQITSEQLPVTSEELTSEQVPVTSEKGEQPQLFLIKPGTYCGVRGMIGNLKYQLLEKYNDIMWRVTRLIDGAEIYVAADRIIPYPYTT
jgi:hypothetical protein